jgi:hypothetical protein
MTKTMLDEETQSQIQSFVSWAASRGYHVIGALIASREDHKPQVRIFSTAPEGDFKKQGDHATKLVDILHYTVHRGKSEQIVNLPIGKM